jgi:hypothetical protein
MGRQEPDFLGTGVLWKSNRGLVEMNIKHRKFHPDTSFNIIYITRKMMFPD